MGVCYDDGDGCPQSAEEAFAWYKKAAQQGDLSAQFNLSWCYYDGTGTPQDPEQALFCGASPPKAAMRMPRWS